MSSFVIERVRRQTAGSIALPSSLARALLFVVLGACVAASLAGVTAPEAKRAAAAAGTDLTNLLRFMALLKGALAAMAAAAVLWRLGIGVTALRLLGYAVASGAMVSGPGLIWVMVHVGLGTLLLHGGLLATGLLLWRDPAIAVRLEGMIHARMAKRSGSATRG